MPDAYKIPDVKDVKQIRRLICGTVLMTLAGMAPLVSAQPPANSGRPVGPEFEAVSIHVVDPHAAGDSSRESMSSFPSNLFTVRSTPLAFLIQLAYKVEGQEHIAAMPGWMESQQYDVTAKVEGAQQLTLEEMRPLLQRLLERRFHLAAHRETRMVSGFDLVVAKGGPRLKPSADGSQVSARVQPNRLTATHIDLKHFAGILAHHADQPVIDKTGVAGVYDFTLAYAPSNDANSGLPDFFTALQEQLGLKLEPGKVPVEFLVIDHVDRIPTEN